MRLGAVVMAKASDQIVEKGRRIAASLLEAAEPDIEFVRRRFTVKGTDRSVDLFEVAAAAVRAGEPLAGACTEVMPAPSYPYGWRGGGEGGTTPALGAIVNAVVDALAEFGIEHLDMPVTPERVWRAIHGGNGYGR